MPVKQKELYLYKAREERRLQEGDQYEMTEVKLTEINR